MHTLHIDISLSLSYMLQPYIFIPYVGLAARCHVRPDNLLYALLTTTVVALIIEGHHLSINLTRKSNHATTNAS